jgi:AraC family transcriptional regulator
MLAAHVLYGSSITDLPTEGALTGSALGDVLDYMRSNLHGAVGLDELAAVAHLTKYHFLRSFAKSTGVTPHRYLVRLRMRRAAALLLDQGPTVLQVARACGYHSQGQFAAAFRREYGTSPREFRRQRRR